MATAFTLLWTSEVFFNPADATEFRHIASDQLKEVDLGDVVWVVSIKDGCLFTAGPLTITTPVISRENAAKRLNREVFDANLHVVIPAKDAEPRIDVEITDLAWKLRFAGSKKDRLVPRGGKVYAQELRVMRQLTPESAALLRSEWGERTGVPTHQPAATPSIMAGDKLVLHNARIEQQALRQILFGNATTGVCVLCGRNLPIKLLIAAHFKRRADALQLEREDVANLAPMCLLGCDALYENGFVTVENGVIKTVAASGPSDLTEALQRLDGKTCSAWSESSKGYFDWHCQQVRRKL